MKVAIVGAGVGGLSAAYHLRAAHDVTLFERERTAGGHAHTAIVPTRDGPLPVDTGFIVYNEATYPGFTRMLRDLDVPTQASDMSFSSHCRACSLEFSSRGARGFFAQPASWLRPEHWWLLRDLRRFFAEARRMLDTGSDRQLTLGAYLEAWPGSRGLGRHFLVPMAAAIWSTAPAAVLRFPLAYLLRFLDNHGLIGLGRTLQWRTVRGGSREYVRRMLATLPARAVRTAVDLRAVTRSAGSDGRPRVTVHVDGASEGFDAVVLATHADQALRLLTDATSQERAALSGFGYTTNRVVLHRDQSLMPRRAAARASWNVLTADCARPGAELTMTYDLSRLQSLPGPDRYYVSVNPPALAQRDVIAEYAYEHPQYDFGTLAAQRRVEAIQGEHGVYFAGAHLGHGFHEDGFRSGAAVARRIESAAGARPAEVAPARALR
ncbi:MAG: FAD-dependent oxidoreductase [Chloroflexi bacterium]|nr:FAD-dependent oxidoreductase [Chloroflexota bacterium]MDA1003314.1 FAD-dependent oxidoreductase [Chloroflexota bacterium]